MNRKGLTKAVALLIAALVATFVLVVLIQHRQVEYIFSGNTVAATVVQVDEKDAKKAEVTYISKDGEQLEGTAVLKQSAEAGESIYLVVGRNDDKLFQIPNKAAIMVFDVAFLLCEFLGWAFAMRLLKKLRRYKKLERKGIKTTAEITSVKNTSGVLGADIVFFDGEGNKRTTVYYPESDIPSVGDKIDIVYYIKNTGKIVFIVPGDE